MARKIQKKDWRSIEQQIKDQLDIRERNEYRKQHERIWKEVDRQVAMQPMQRTPRDINQETDWRNALELGELSRASEIITADVRRLTFPQTRAWFEIHSDLTEIDDDVDPASKVEIQSRVDGRLRAFMTQQHLDFGLKSRVDLSVKEALHHGGYVVTTEWETAVQVAKGDRVKTVAAPLWKPHSMWNCYPDLSAGIEGHNTFYQGSMIIKSWMPLYQVKRLKSIDDDYPYFNLNKITVDEGGSKEKNRQDTNDVEILTYYGDLVIPRSQGDLLLLNSKFQLANGTIIHYMPNPFPYPNVIYNGWERLDVRDPYYVSPIVKFSVTQKIGTQLANRLLDSVDLKVEPPITYDGNDPDFVANGGPEIAPGAKTPTKGSGSYDVINVGDPATALAGLQYIVQQIEAGTRVDRVRSGVSPATEQTATEVIKQSQNAELSVVDFVDRHELHGLRPFLYMSYDLNREKVKSYPFYNQELNAPDFERMSKSEMPKSVHVEIVGSKGVLGEERRQAQTSQVTAFWMRANPQLLKQQELAMEMYRDAGNKNPEKFLNIGDEAQAFQQQLEAIVQQAQAQIQALQQEITSFQFQDEEHSLEIEQKELEKEQLQTRITVLEGLIRFNRGTT